MKLWTRFLSAFVGASVLASVANADIRFYYGYGDEATASLQRESFGGVIANGGASVGSEVPDGGTITMPVGGGTIRLQVWAENTGAGHWVNAVSIFNAFDRGATSSAPIYRRDSALGDVGQLSDADPYMQMVSYGGSSLANSTTWANSLETWSYLSGAWTSESTVGTFSEVQSYAIQGSEVTAPEGDHYVGYGIEAGLSPLGEVIRLGQGSKTHIADVTLASGIANGPLNVYGDDPSETGLKLLVGTNLYSSGTFFLGGRNSQFGFVDPPTMGSSYKLMTTPEPGTWLALALGALGFVRRRR